MSKNHPKNHNTADANSAASDKSAKGSGVGVVDGKDVKFELNENGVSAKKAEECMAASCETGLSDLGQSGSVPVGQKEVTAPHLEADQLSNKKPETKAEGDACDSKKPETKAEGDACDSKKPEGKAKSNTKEKGKESAENADSLVNASDLKAVANIGLEVAAGLALMAVDSANKVMKESNKNWEGKVDAVAQKAHDTIENVQKVIRDPLGETLKQVDHLAHPAAKAEKKDEAKTPEKK